MKRLPAAFIAHGKATKTIKPFILWNDWRWIKDHEGYYRCHQRGPMYEKRLHRAIWEKAHGEIPPKHQIDHIDQNKENNTLENFQCVPEKYHGRKSRAHQTALGKENGCERQEKPSQEAQPQAQERELEPWDIDPIKDPKA